MSILFIFLWWLHLCDTINIIQYLLKHLSEVFTLVHFSILSAHSIHLICNSILKNLLMGDPLRFFSIFFFPLSFHLIPFWLFIFPLLPTVLPSFSPSSRRCWPVNLLSYPTTYLYVHLHTSLPPSLYVSLSLWLIVSLSTSGFKMRKTD